MNDLLLSLAVSPGGADAIAGLMAKAPPGESPPVLSTSFLQMLLQSLPAGGGTTIPAGLLSMVPAHAESTLQQDAPEPGATPGEGAPETEGLSLPALELAVLAQAFAASLTAEPQPAATANAETPAIPVEATPAGTVAARSTAAALLVEALPAEATEQTAQQLQLPPVEVADPEPVSAKPGELDAKIPAPEVREGSARTERPVLQAKAIPEIEGETPAAEAGHHPEPVQKGRHTEVPAPPTAGGSTAAATTEPAGPAVSRPRVVPLGEEPVVERSMSLPVSDTPASDPKRAASATVKLSASEGSAGKAERSAANVVPDRQGQTISDEPDVPEKPAVRPPGQHDTGRERVAETDVRTAHPGRSAERMVLVDLPVTSGAPDMPAVGSAVKNESPRRANGEPPADVKGGEATPETSAGQSSQLNGTVPQREAQEPVAGRQPLEGTRGYGVKEHFGPSLKEPHGATGNMAGKLTEELSRNMFDQVVKHVALQVKGEMSEMRIRLDPPSLGEMQVTVRVDEGRVHAQIDVSQPTVRVALETGIPQLRQILADQGIEVHRIEVCASGSSMSRESGEGHGHRPRKREGGRHQGALDGVEQYRGVRMMGYNTIEMVM